MKTWSAEQLIVGFFDKLRTLGEITRPPRLGHDVDTEVRPCDTGDCYYEAHGMVCPHHCFDDGGEQLSEREAEVDSWLPDELWNAGWEWTPIPEPPLTDDELVGVRQMLEERFGDQITGGKVVPTEERGHSPRPPSVGR